MRLDDRADLAPGPSQKRDAEDAIKRIQKHPNQGSTIAKGTTH